MSVLKNKFSLLALTVTLIFLLCVGCSKAETGSVYLYAVGDAVQIHDANGKYLKITDGHVEDGPEVINIVNESDEFGCMVEVPYSNSFIFEGSGNEKVQYSVVTNLENYSAGMDYSVSATGVSTVAISLDGKMLIDGNDFTFETFGFMKNDILGYYGNVRISGAAENSVEVRYDTKKATIYFDGITPDFLFMTVNGTVSAKGITIPHSGSGTISLADLADGTVTVTDSSGNIQTISVPVSIIQSDETDS